MSDFHETLFPVDISYGSAGGPKWKTAVTTIDSGYEARVIDWANTRGQYDVSYGIKDQSQIEVMHSFFRCRRGRAFGFRFKDWNDYTVENEHLGTGDYGEYQYQITKTYASDSPDGTPYRFVRDIRKIEWGAVSGVQITGVQIDRAQDFNGLPDSFQRFAVDDDTGLMTLRYPMWGGLYAGQAPYTDITFIPAGGTNATGYDGQVYDPVRGKLYLRGSFPSGTGIRRIDVDTAEEDLQVHPNELVLPESQGLYSIVAVDPDGFLYGTCGFANGTILIKLDPDSFTIVAAIGTMNSQGPANGGVTIPGGPCMVSLDGSLLCYSNLYALGGQIQARETTGLGVQGILVDDQGYQLHTANISIGCQFNANGFAFAGNLGDGLSLWLFLGGNTTVRALTFGAAGDYVAAMIWDKKQEGVVILWFDHNDQAWAGLYTVNKEGFVWKRKMPHSIGYLNTSNIYPSMPSNGVLAWVASASPFGQKLWLLDTATGVLTARDSYVGDGVHGTGGHQSFDPDKKVVIATGSVERIVQIDVDGIDFTPPEELTLGHAEFHIGVRFDTDYLNLKHEFWNTQSWDSIPLVEVRNWSDVELD